MVTIWQLFMAFLRAGIFGYGGGPGSIPLIRKEVVDTYSWFSDEQFAEALAFGNALPGPIATKLASYVGFQVAGPIGAVMAIAGMVAPTALGMVLLYGVFTAYKEVPRIQSMLNAVKPIVAVLLLQVTVDIARTAFPAWTFVVLAGFAVFAIFVFQLHPAVVIATGLAAGALLPLH